MEDDEDIRANFVAALKAEGYEVAEAANGRIALDYLLSLSPAALPQCMILDLMMPEMDGKTFLTKVRTDHASKLGRIKVIVATAKGSPINPESIPFTVARIQKPMELDELYRMVRKVCGQSGT